MRGHHYAQCSNSSTGGKAGIAHTHQHQQHPTPSGENWHVVLGGMASACLSRLQLKLEEAHRSLPHPIPPHPGEPRQHSPGGWSISTPLPASVEARRGTQKHAASCPSIFFGDGRLLASVRPSQASVDLSQAPLPKCAPLPGFCVPLQNVAPLSILYSGQPSLWPPKVRHCGSPFYLLFSSRCDT